MEKVLKIDRPGGRRVLKFDSRAAAEGCGIACGDEYEVSVTGIPSRRTRHSEPQAKNLGTQGF